jgi:RNA recognition motif. (a.k.a. RRM, RBD, or RNP domain)
VSYSFRRDILCIARKCNTKYFRIAEKALATLQSRPLPGLTPPVPLVLSPYPPTSPPTPLPPPSALPRLVKHLIPGFIDSQLYDLFRPFGALASARTQTHFGPDTGIVEFWNEDDARAAEEALHCADVEGQNIAVQVYQPRRTSGTVAEFNTNAPTFVPSGSVYPYPTQVHCCASFDDYRSFTSFAFCSILLLAAVRIQGGHHYNLSHHLCMGLVNKFS